MLGLLFGVGALGGIRKDESRCLEKNCVEGAFSSTALYDAVRGGIKSLSSADGCTSELASSSEGVSN